MYCKRWYDDVLITITAYYKANIQQTPEWIQRQKIQMTWTGNLYPPKSQHTNTHHLFHNPKIYKNGIKKYFLKVKAIGPQKHKIPSCQLCKPCKFLC